MCAPKAIPVVCISIRDAYQFLVDHYPLYQHRNNELAADHDGLNGPQKQFQRGIEAMEGAMINEPTPLASAGRAAAVEQGFNPEFNSLMAQYLKNQDKIMERQQTSLDTLTTAVTTQRGDISNLTTSMATQQSNINDLTTSIATMKEELTKASEDQVSVLAKAVEDMRHDHAEEMKDVLRQLQQGKGKFGKGDTWTKEEQDILVAAYHKYTGKNGRLNRIAMLQELKHTIGQHRSDNAVRVKLERLRHQKSMQKPHQKPASSTAKDRTAGMSREDSPSSTTEDRTADMSRQELGRTAIHKDSWYIKGVDLFPRETLGHWVKAYYSGDGYYYDAKIIEILSPDPADFARGSKPDQEQPDPSCMAPRFKIAWQDKDHLDVIKDLDDLVWQKEITDIGITKSTYRVQFACSDGQLAWTPKLVQETMLSPHVLQRFQANQSKAGSAAQKNHNDDEFVPRKAQRTLPNLTLKDSCFTVAQLSPRSKANYDSLVESGVRAAKALVACSKHGYANMHFEHKQSPSVYAADRTWRKT